MDPSSGRAAGLVGAAEVAEAAGGGDVVLVWAEAVLEVAGGAAEEADGGEAAVAAAEADVEAGAAAEAEAGAVAGAAAVEAAAAVAAVAVAAAAAVSAPAVVVVVVVIHNANLDRLSFYSPIQSHKCPQLPGNSFSGDNSNWVASLFELVAYFFS